MNSATNLILKSTFAKAEQSGSHTEHHPVEIPWQRLTPQFINFAVFVVLLFVLLRKHVSGFFSKRVETFNQALVKAEAARREAEAKKVEIQQRLARLEGGSATDIERAKRDSEEMKSKILQDAAEVAGRLKAEALRSAKSEFEQAQDNLKRELASEAVLAARRQLSERMVEKDQARLQTEFVEKVQAGPQ